MSSAPRNSLPRRRRMASAAATSDSKPPPESTASHTRSSVEVGSTLAYMQSHHCDARISMGTCTRRARAHGRRVAGRARMGAGSR
eukprot:6744184-Prymnesium_polylepis.2